MDNLKFKLESAKRENESETVRVGVNEITDLLNPNKKDQYAGSRLSMQVGDKNALHIDKEYEAAKLSYISQREKELREELGNYKPETDNLTTGKPGEEEELMNLMREVELKREKEIRDQVEREQIKSVMANSDHRQLNRLESEKRQVISKLDAERRQLEEQEAQIQIDIERMAKHMDYQEKQYKNSKEAKGQKEREAQAQHDERLNRKKREIAEQRGQEVAKLQQVRGDLEHERNQILNDMNKVKRGQYDNLYRPNISGLPQHTESMKARKIPQEARELQAKYDAEQKRLDQLKLSHANFVEQHHIPIDQLGKRERFFDKVEELVHDTDALLGPSDKARVMNHIRSDLQGKDPIRENTPVQQNRRAGANRTIEPPEVSRSVPNFGTQEVPKLDGPEAKPATLLENVENIKQNYENQPGKDRNLLKGMEDLENSLKNNPVYKGMNDMGPGMQTGAPGMPQGMQTGPPGMPPGATGMPGMPSPGMPGMPSPGMSPNPGMPNDPYSQYYAQMMQQNPYMMNPYMNPYAPWMMQPQNDPEQDAVKKRLKKLQKQLNAKDDDVYNNEITDMLGMIGEKLAARDAGPGQQRQEQISPEQKALANLAQQEAQDLRQLAAIPQNSDMYQKKMEHFKSMSAMRHQMEQMLQEQAIERMTREFENEMAEDDRRHKEGQWEEQQKREIIAERIRKANAPPTAGYSPDQGFQVFWDVITGLPRRNRFCQMVYAVYERGETRLPPQLVIGVNTEGHTEYLNKATFRTQHDIKRIPANATNLLIIEIHAAERRPQGEGDPALKNFGWTVVDLFNYERALQTGVWKLPVYKAPTDPRIDMYEVKNLIPILDAYLYLRIVPAGSRINEPSSLEGYLIPPPHRRGNQQNQPLSRQQSQARQPSNMAASIPPRTSSRQSMYRQNTSVVPKGQNPLNNNGIGVRVVSVYNVATKGILRFKVSVQEGRNICRNVDGRDCLTNGEAINTQRGGSQILLNDTVKNRSLVDGSVAGSQAGTVLNAFDTNQDFQFAQNFYTSLADSNWEQNIFVVIQLQEKLSVESNISSGRQTEFQTIAWTVYQVSDSESRSLTYGTYELNLFMPPVTVPFADPRELKPHGGSLKVSLYEPTDIRLNLSRQRDAVKTPRNRTPAPANREPFIENTAPQYDDYGFFEKGSGVDFYIDGARFLPDNVSASKVIVRAMTSNLEKVGPAKGGLPDLNSSVYSPVFGFRMEFRAPSFDPTTTIIISLETIDTKHNEVRVIGYCAINIFLNKYRKVQPTSPQDTEFILNQGCFQLPIYCAEPYRKPPFSLENLTRMEIIPTATVLVRIREAQRTEDGRHVLGADDVLPDEWISRGVVVPPPMYESRVYNTQYCMPSIVEKYLYQERMNRQDITVRDSSMLIQQQLGYKMELGDDQILDWIDSKIRSDTRSPIIDMKYFAKYNPKIGFKFAVDAVHGLSTEAPHVVLFCLNPPGALYRETVNPSEVQFTTKIDFNSAVKTPMYLDGFSIYKNLEFGRNISLLIDVRSVHFARGKTEVKPVGWTLLPIFTADGYVSSGVFQLPVFKGGVPNALVRDLATNAPWETAMSLTGGGRSGRLQLLEPTSVIVRLSDAQRDGHFATPMDLNKMNYEFIPKEKLGKYAYNAAAHAKVAQQKRVRALVGNQTVESFQQKVNQVVSDEFGLFHMAPSNR